MRNESLIDDINLLSDDKNFYTDLLKWWESKRIYYNLTLIVLELSIMLFFLESTISFGIISAIVLTILTNIIANGFYCLGWILEILFYYYFRKTIFLDSIRLTLLISGLLFSLFLISVMYIVSLSF